MVTTATAPRPAAPPRPQFKRSRGIQRIADRIMLFGTGGVGKSSLAAMAPKPLVIDTEGGTRNIDIERIDGIRNWSDLRQFIQTVELGESQSLVIDTVTTAEDWCRDYIIKNVTTDKGKTVSSIEGFGWNKGYVHLQEEWKRLLGDLERHYLTGKNIILVAHDRIGKVPNPNGDDYIRNEPRLYNGKEVSLMYTTKEWCDHVLFVGYDVAASDGKAKGSGTRTIYTAETATYVAKSRTLPPDPIVFEKNSRLLWERLNGNSAEMPPM